METRWRWWNLLVAVATLSSGLCFAQENPEIVGEESYTACLTPVAAERGSPEYPVQQLFTKTGGEVRVALTFTSKDAGPSVRLLSKNQWNVDAEEAFLRSIEKFVSKYRLPCLTGKSAELGQTFTFSPESRSVYPSDASDGLSPMSKSKCRWDYVGSKPTYPEGTQRPLGNVVLQMSFAQRDEPPSVTVIYGGGHYLLSETAKQWASAYRLRCETPLEKPVVTKLTNRFVPTGGMPMVLKDLDFVSFLKSVDRKSLGTPKFDFNSMSCPFDVKVTLLQPHAPNDVAEISTYDGRRTEFLSWMKTLVFSYPKDFERFLIGQSLQVSVPCMVLDLG